MHMVYGIGAAMNGTKRAFPAILLAAGLMLPEGRAHALQQGTKLTNYVKGKFNLASGSLIEETIPGKSPLNIANSASAWVVVTDEPQLCFSLDKVAQKRPPLWTLTPQASPGERLCFTVSFSNCGTQTVYTVNIRDRTPANVIMESPWLPVFWVGQPNATVSIEWYEIGSDVPSNDPIAGQVGPIDLDMTFYITDPFAPGITIGVSGYINYCVTVL